MRLIVPLYLKGLKFVLSGLKLVLSGLKPALPGLKSALSDSRPERAVFRPERADFRPERTDFRPERVWGGGWTDGRMDGRKNSPLCSTGLCPLRGRCPASPQINNHAKQGNGYR